MLAMDSGHSIQEEITANRVAAHAHLALAQRGLNAQAEPTWDAEFDRRVSNLADATADMMWSETGTERMRHQISDFLGTQATGIELATGRMAKLNAMAAAAHSVADELASRTGTSQLEQSRKLVALLEQDVSNIPAAAIEEPRAPSQTTMAQRGIDEHNSMQGAERKTRRRELPGTSWRRTESKGEGLAFGTVSARFRCHHGPERPVRSLTRVKHADDCRDQTARPWPARFPRTWSIGRSEQLAKAPRKHSGRSYVTAMALAAALQAKH